MYFRLEDVALVNPIQLELVDIANSHIKYSGGGFSFEVCLTLHRSRQLHCFTRGTEYFKGTVSSSELLSVFHASSEAMVMSNPLTTCKSICLPIPLKVSKRLLTLTCMVVSMP
ncbi:hypothetical protein ACTXT7_016882 [Hymenolepis weldensis]